MITLPKLVDFIVAYFIKRSERKPDDLAPECEADKRKFRSQIWDGNKHHSIF